jgi:hypothetical protein
MKHSTFEVSVYLIIILALAILVACFYPYLEHAIREILK